MVGSRTPGAIIPPIICVSLFDCYISRHSILYAGCLSITGTQKCWKNNSILTLIGKRQPYGMSLEFSYFHLLYIFMISWHNVGWHIGYFNRYMSLWEILFDCWLFALVTTMLLYRWFFLSQPISDIWKFYLILKKRWCIGFPNISVSVQGTVDLWSYILPIVRYSHTL